MSVKRTDARIAVLRPDFGVAGGFERHLETVVAGLTERGWHIQQIGLEARKARSRLFGLPIQPVQHEFHDDFFKYASLVSRTLELDLGRYDAVLTTQPPTYLARHPAKVALFYHQARQFYDLADAYVQSGFAEPGVHEATVAAVHKVDKAGIVDVRHWLAGSATSAGRLQEYWSIPRDRISLYQAPPACAVDDRPPRYEPSGPILHVGRMEWPKRAELLVHAVHGLQTPRSTCFVGGGSRAAYVKSLDAELHRGGTTAEQLHDDRTWLTRGIFTAGWQPSQAGPSGRIDFLGAVENAPRDRLYRSASVVVAPAHNEDYGLTALEAMSFARPVIVCKDGGGLTEIVEDGVTGLVVEPRAATIAAAIDRLLANPGYAAALGTAGYERVASLTDDRSVSQIEQAFEKVLAGDHSF